MTPSKILFYLSLSFIIGIGLESIIKIPQFILWIFLASAIILILVPEIVSFFPRDKKLIIYSWAVIWGFCLMFFVIGILRLQISEFNVASDELSKFNDKEEIILEGTIVGEPVLKDNSQRLKIHPVEYAEGVDSSGQFNWVKVENSTILATVSRYPEYKYFDKLKITGKLQTPMETEDFSYKNYLLKDHIYSVMYFPEIKKTGGGRASAFSYVYSGILYLKQKMRQSIRSNFLPPHSSVLEGVILGDKNAISQEIKDKFRITGLSHIIAVSGLHIVILSSIIMHFLLFLGIGRNLAFYVVSLFILIYVILVGLPSSAVRAGIMGAAYLLSQKIGRQSMSSRLVVLAAGLMLLFNPLLLFYDVGFQLSFLAVLGIILLEPAIRFFIKFLAHRFFRLEIKQKYQNALSLFTVTISAQIFTMPVIIYNFGNVSFVSLFTNILVLPSMPIVMLFGFLSASAGALFNVLGWVLSAPCYVLLSYIFWTVDAFSKPWAYKIIPNVSWVWLAVSYIFLGFITRYFNRKIKMKFLGY